MADFRAGVRLAVTTLTVVPLRPGSVDRRVAAFAMSLAPAVGLALGAVLAGIGLAARAVHMPVLLAAVLIVAGGVLLTRGLHVDGLADTVDGLGSYRDAEGALEVMKRPDVGPFGVAAVVLVLLVQVTAAAAVLGRPWYAAFSGIVAVTGTGRLAIALACLRGVPAARPDGLGALVAGTVPARVVVLGLIGVAAVALPAVPDRPWQGPLAVAAGLLAAALLLRHCLRRLGGVTGDVLGATCELAVCVGYVLVAAGTGLP